MKYIAIFYERLYTIAKKNKEKKILLYVDDYDERETKDYAKIA